MSASHPPRSPKPPRRRPTRIPAWKSPRRRHTSGLVCATLALGLVCTALALGLAAPVAPFSSSAHAAPRAGRPPGGPAISIHGSAPAGASSTSAAAPYAPGVVVVGYGPKATPTARAAIARAADAAGARENLGVQGDSEADGSVNVSEDPRAAGGIDVSDDRRAAGGIDVGGESVGEDPGVAGNSSHTQLLTLAPGASLPATLARLRHTQGVAWAVPDYIAHEATLPLAASPPPTPATTPTTTPAAGADSDPPAASAATGQPFPNDPGLARVPGGWQQLQWNFVGEFGVQAPQAWSNLIADHAPGGRGVVVAVLDTGVAYSNRGPFRISPDFYRYQFVKGYDFIAHNHYPNDRNGHGTDVAGTIAEATNNGKGLTGLAYGVRLMPVRVLDSEGNGDASTIARGVRWAVNHGARVINLSLEFPTGITASDIPELISALRYANRHRVVVVAAAGNEAHAAAAYPARASGVIAVGATTEHGCLASYSNYGTGLTLVAPGGGPDATLPGDPNCHPEGPPGKDVFQVTFTGASPRKFGIPDGYEGTSMATPHVAATAALIIASRVLGRHPTPAQVAARLIATARPLGGPGDAKLYGAGLLDAAAATAPGGPGAAVQR
jgi:serine protease